MEPDCPYCAPREPHPFFVYIAKSEGQRDSTHKTHCVPYIGLSRHPFHRVSQHNRHVDYRVGAKSTKAGAPHWEIVTIFGPFWSHATAFKEDLRKLSRKLASRVIRGVISAARYGVPIWVTDRMYVQKLFRERSLSLRTHPPPYTERETRIKARIRERRRNGYATP